MNESAKTRAPVWFLVVSILFLLWNLFGLAVFILTVFVLTTRDALENAGLNAEQAELMLSTPTWVNIAFGTAVVFGVLGSLALVMKRALAIPLLVISLVGVLAQNTYTYLLSDAIDIMGVGASPVVIAAAIAAVPFAVFCRKQGWLISSRSEAQRSPVSSL